MEAIKTSQVKILLIYHKRKGVAVATPLVLNILQ